MHACLPASLLHLTAASTTEAAAAKTAATTFAFSPSSLFLNPIHHS
jgi:hypothetical protein